LVIVCLAVYVVVRVETISMSFLHATLEGYWVGEHSKWPSFMLNATCLGCFTGAGEDFLLPPIALPRALSLAPPGLDTAIGVRPPAAAIVTVDGVSVTVRVTVSDSVETVVLTTEVVSNTVDVLLYVSVTWLRVDVDMTVAVTVDLMVQGFAVIVMEGVLVTFRRAESLNVSV